MLDSVYPAPPLLKVLKSWCMAFLMQLIKHPFPALEQNSRKQKDAKADSYDNHK